MLQTIQTKPLKFKCRNLATATNNKSTSLSNEMLIGVWEIQFTVKEPTMLNPCQIRNFQQIWVSEDWVYGAVSYITCNQRVTSSLASREGSVYPDLPYLVVVVVLVFFVFFLWGKDLTAVFGKNIILLLQLQFSVSFIHLSNAQSRSVYHYTLPWAAAW